MQATHHAAMKKLPPTPYWTLGLLCMCFALPAVIVQAQQAGQLRQFTIAAQIFEVPKNDMVIAQIEAPKADLNLLLRKISSLADAGSIKLIAMPITSTRSGRRASVTMEDNIPIANGMVGRFGMEVAPLSDGVNASLDLTVYHGAETLKSRLGLKLGEVGYAGKLEKPQGKTVELVFIQVFQQESQAKTSDVPKIAGPKAGVPAVASSPPAPAKNAEKPEEAARKSAEQWVVMIDTGKYANSWKAAADSFQAAVPQKEWENHVRDVRRPFGKLVSRQFKSAQYTRTLPNAAEGEYVILQFTVLFSNGSKGTETITPMLDNYGQWKVSGYYIHSLAE